MDRAAWLAERRVAILATYDADAAAYDENAYPAEAQREWVAGLVALTPPGGIILDAPCGTGRYFTTVVDAGRRVVGADQSAGMLDQARARGLATSLEILSLQDLSYDREFDGVLTVDAMENVPPEDWPVVLANLRRAVRPGGPIYMTVEEIDEAEIEAAFASLSARGEPAVLGEVVEGDVAGYHYYPGRARVLGWFEAEGLGVEAEVLTPEDGWAYRHFLLRAPG
jgi:cyclopropane fatty-acyl-phospholipid synthase-like methyltransferase